MKIIGITGKSGSGKTTFASLLAKELECKHIDIDKIGHEALYRPEIIDTLCEKFGTEILDKNGLVDRKKLGNIVFSDKNKMQILTDLTWNYMQQRLDSILSQNDDIIVFDWILLPTVKYWEKCDCKILVTSDDEKRKKTVIQRDNISEEYFDKRDSSSIDFSEISFDYIVKNNYQLQTFQKMINEICEKYIGGNKK